MIKSVKNDIIIRNRLFDFVAADIYSAIIEPDIIYL
jgi:hypothetical protein